MLADGSLIDTGLYSQSLRFPCPAPIPCRNRSNPSRAKRLSPKVRGAFRPARHSTGRRPTARPSPRTAGRNWPRKIALRLPSLPHFLLVLLAIPAFMLLGEAVDSVAKHYVRSLFDLDEFMGIIGYWPWWLGVLIIGFGPGIGEELIFRA